MKKTSVLGVFAALLLVSIAAAVYAHGVDSSQFPDSSNSRWNMMGHMMSLQDMDEMHESMTEGMDPELKEQMDDMHEGCTSGFKQSDTNNKGGGMIRSMMG